MFRNYFKVALRNLVNNKVYSLINIGGLAIGIATALLILLWVADEWSYDRHNTNAKDIYRTIVHWEVGGQQVAYTTTPAPFADFIKSGFPEAQQVTRFAMISNALFSYQDEPSRESQGAYTDQATLEMFTYHFVEGNPASALTEPHSLVLSQSLAQKYFGDEQAVGKTIRFDNADELMVTAVFEDMPENSHLHFNYFIPFHYFAQKRNIGEDNWNDFNYYTYVQLEAQTSGKAMEEKITAAINQRFEGATVVSNVELQPLLDIHLYSNFGNDISGNGDIQYVYIFSAIAFFIIIIACINFMNLATARSVKRSKEIGLRKTVGAVRYQLVAQFLGEAILFTLIAVVLAALIVELVLPAYNGLAQKQISLNLLDGKIMGVLLLITLLTGLSAGLYPALFLSSFHPAKVLKGTFKAGKGGIVLRKGLVVLQFALSIILIVGTLVIDDQLTYIRNKKLGYEKDNILVVPMAGEIYKNQEAYRNTLLDQPGITQLTSASQNLNDISSTTSGADWEGKTAEQEVLLNQLSVDLDFIKTFNIQMVEGRAFSRERSTDSSAFIVNEEAVKQMGLENPVGSAFSLHGVKGTIIGVTEDFNFQSVHKTIAPLVLFVSPNWRSSLYIKVDNQAIPEALAVAEASWKELNPAYPFEYSFLDESFDAMYKAEARTGKLFNYFAFIAIFISCLGLFGLAAYTAELRTKEVGVRKVMGASVGSILLLFSQDYVKLVLIAFVIATPCAYLLMHRWLEDFAYRTDISPLVFVLAIVFSMAITLLTVGYQSMKAATANPVKSLRSE
ncbi:ABC transporter permease [Catalinimonas niigatensis]|uniref:ABC transporter permease n=1 Tax=Catalinimonas niigatensis TaxID=1397264 RepID=UPI002665AECA|nr:ABC transporter permease [Catalinimonas niigatensis]WPP48451.1 ABC transporter permease [Catalinimonas niigatensis]